MAKQKVRVLNAVVAGKRKGEVVELTERQVDHLVKIGYVELIDEPVEEAKPKAEAKKPARKRTKKTEE
jgi:hypothetical protein